MKSIFRLFARKKKFQNVFQFLLDVALKGLNYGNGADFRESGELWVLNYLKEKYNEENKLIFFDVGGNIGNYAKKIAEIFEKKTNTYTFEPSGKTYKILLDTVKGIDNIHPYPIGLGNKEEARTLYTNNEGSGIASVYKRNLEHFGVSMNISEEIQLSTIDIFCKNNQIEKIHFLKLDIEGHELSALHGAKEMLGKGKIEHIQFEFGGCNIDSRTYFQDFYYLLHDKYKIYRILKDGLYEINSYKETLEIFSTINYLAVSKDYVN